MPNLLTERATSFALGVNDSAAPDEYRQEESQKLVNFRPALNGNSLERRGVAWCPNTDHIFGGINYQPRGAIEWELTSGARQIVALTTQSSSGDGLFYSNDQGVTWQAWAGAVNQPANNNVKASFATIESGGTNYLIIALGGVLTYKWDGTTLTALANIPSGVLYVESFNNRLIAAGHSGTRVVASKVADPDTWAAPDGWDIDAATSDGDNFITGLFQLGPILMVFKRESVGYIEGFGFQTIQVQTGARGISRSVGCIASHSIAPLGDYGVMWLSERGFEAYTLNTGQVQLVSRSMQGFVNAIMKFGIVAEGFGVPQGIWVPGKREYWCAVPVGLYSDGKGTGEYLVNNYVYVFRPGSATEPSAQWAFTWSDARSGFEDPGSSVAISDDSMTYPGALFSEPGSRVESQVIIGEDGVLRVTEQEEFGLDVTLKGVGIDGNFGFGPSNNGTYQYSAGSPRGDMLPICLFTADHDGQLSQPCFISFWGWLWYADDELTTLEEGKSFEPGFGDSNIRDIEAVVHARPLIFGDQFTPKQLHRARIQTTQDRNTDVLVRTRADGVAAPEQTITAAASKGGRPVKNRIRTRGKGYVLDMEVESGSSTNDSFKVLAIEADARYLKTAR